MTTKRTVVISDLQIPYNDKHVTRNIIQFIKQFRPDAVASVGDELDLPQVSRWEEGRQGWYEQTLADHRDEAVETLWALGEYAKEQHMVRSNHLDRLYSVIARRVPAFHALPELRLEKFLKLDELGIKYWKDPFPIAKGWVMVHGDQTPLNPNPGMSALNAAKRYGLNVISGHTHRAGRSAISEASGGVLRRVLHGVEVGHLMDIKKAAYTHGSPNWQQAFAIVSENGKNVQIDLIHIEKDGTFCVWGKRYGRPRA